MIVKENVYKNNLPNFNNAKLINTTATTLGVKGNGKTIGINNGSNNLGFSNNNAGTISIAGAYNVAVGTTVGATGITQTKAIGLVTDTSTSGIVANMPATITPKKWVIKY